MPTIASGPACSSLWHLAPRKLVGALTVPAQAVQTGPEKKFLYVIGEDNKVASLPINVRSDPGRHRRG